MASACSMYYVEPLVHTSSGAGDMLSSSKCSMYEVPPMVPLSLDAAAAGSPAEGGAALQRLARRHEALLGGLKALQRTLDALTEAEATSASTSAASTGLQLSGIPSFEGAPHEVVVQCAPDCPPYCALPLVAALRGSGLRVALMSQRHSSLSKGATVSAEVEARFNSMEGPREGHHLVLRVLWGPGQLQTRVSPIQQGAILGHANLLRYLCRLLPASHPLNYEGRPLASVAATDALLEVCGAAVGGDQEAGRLLAEGAGQGGEGVGEVMLWVALRAMQGRGPLPAALHVTLKALDAKFLQA